MEKEMTSAGTELRGPVDFVLIEFPGDKLTGRGAEALIELVDRGIISIYDLMVIGKNPAGETYMVDMSASDVPELGGFKELAWAISGLLTEEDVEEAANAMEPGTLAVLIVYENVWSIPFIVAAWESGGKLVASARLAAQDVTNALDAAEAKDAELMNTSGE
jgi:hypothetical protein